MSRSWDVFCRVVDNYGDAAVCWRLARQLADEQGGRVRLWIDILAPLNALCPDVSVSSSRQVVEGVEVWSWSADTNFPDPAEIAIETFGCGLPEAYVESMAAQDPHPVWVVLEYLSAEPWVVTHHGLPSPHPRLPLQRWFFFPGFVPGTGGVLREASLDSRRAAFEGAPEARARFWRRLGFRLPPPGALVMSLFGYENATAKALLQAWSVGQEPVVIAVPPSRLRADVCAFLGVRDAENGTSVTKGRLETRFLPFVPQPDYDELLWACDWNFVRGEDSVVRAQWARRPFTWQIYPQAEGAHEVKLTAFLDRYCAGLPPGLSDPLRRIWRTWNGLADGSGPLAADWGALTAGKAVLDGHAAAWGSKLGNLGDLAANLALYCEERLK